MKATTRPATAALPCWRPASPLLDVVGAASVMAVVEMGASVVVWWTVEVLVPFSWKIPPLYLWVDVVENFVEDFVVEVEVSVEDSVVDVEVGVVDVDVDVGVDEVVGVGVGVVEVEVEVVSGSSLVVVSGFSEVVGSGVEVVGSGVGSGVTSSELEVESPESPESSEPPLLDPASNATI